MAKTAAARKAATNTKPKATIIKGRPWIWMGALSQKDKWLIDHIPSGESHAPYIKQMSQNSDGSYTYYVYRNSKCIGSKRTLEAAKAMAESGERDQAALRDIAKVREYEEKSPGDAEAFKKLSQYAQTVVANERPWLMPGRSALQAKGVKVKATVVRGDLKSNQEKKADKLALPMDSKIERLRDGNPKKEGSDAWGRWEVLFAHCDGQTVGEYIKNHGNPTTLQNAVAKGWVKVKGMGGK